MRIVYINNLLYDDDDQNSFVQILRVLIYWKNIWYGFFTWKKKRLNLFISV